MDLSRPTTSSWADPFGYVQLALVRRAEHEQLAHLASHDPLTGAVNRAEFGSQLAAALAGADPVAVLCDLDRSRRSTTSATPPATRCAEVADRLRSALGPEEVLARLGGDEFTVLVLGLETLAETAERLVAVIEPLFTVGESMVSLGLSIGIAVAEPGAPPTTC